MREVSTVTGRKSVNEGECVSRRGGCLDRPAVAWVSCLACSGIVENFWSRVVAWIQRVYLIWETLPLHAEWMRVAYIVGRRYMSMTGFDRWMMF